MHRGARSKGIGRKFEHTARATHLSRKKTKDAHEAKAAFMEAFLERRKKEEEKKGIINIIVSREKTKKEEVPVVHGGSTATTQKEDKTVVKKVDLKTCVSEPGEEILVTSLKSRSGGVVGKMAYVGKAFPVEKRKKIAMARKAEIEVALEQKLEKELEGKGDEGDEEERPELPAFIGSMSKKKKKHNKKILRRLYTK